MTSVIKYDKVLEYYKSLKWEADLVLVVLAESEKALKM